VYPPLFQRLDIVTPIATAMALLSIMTSSKRLCCEADDVSLEQHAAFFRRSHAVSLEGEVTQTHRGTSWSQKGAIPTAGVRSKSTSRTEEEKVLSHYI
jgi:hypothetical protein